MLCNQGRRDSRGIKVDFSSCLVGGMKKIGVRTCVCVCVRETENAFVLSGFETRSRDLKNLNSTFEKAAGEAWHGVMKNTLELHTSTEYIKASEFITTIFTLFLDVLSQSRCGKGKDRGRPH